jgi:hypothetical protein|tara:strand:- start:538 stop:819 length:282 start_codon:yes stop_codon:yes gene_type:complete
MLSNFKKDEPRGKGGLIFNPSGMSQSEYRQKIKDSGSTYIPMRKMQEMYDSKSKPKIKPRNRFKDGGAVKKRAKKKKARTGIKVRGTKFKGIF